MAQRTTVTLIDDLDDSEASQTVEFGLDKVTYEIDLSDANAAKLRDALADYVSHARRTSGRAPRTGRPPVSQPTRTASAHATSSTTADREQNKAIRDWSARNGVPVSERGRIPAYVSEAYHRKDPEALRAGAARKGVATGAPAELPDERSELKIETEPVTPPATESSAKADDSWPYDEAPKTRNLSRSDRELVRSWAQHEEIEVAVRGGVKQDVVDRYHAWRTSKSPKLAAVS